MVRKTWGVLGGSPPKKKSYQIELKLDILPQIYRQIDRQIDRYRQVRNRQLDGVERYRQIECKAEIDRQNERYTQIDVQKDVDTQIDRWIDRQIDNWIDRYMDRKIYRWIDSIYLRFTGGQSDILQGPVQ